MRDARLRQTLAFRQVEATGNDAGIQQLLPVQRSPDRCQKSWVMRRLRRVDQLALAPPEAQRHERLSLHATASSSTSSVPMVCGPNFLEGAVIA